MERKTDGHPMMNIGGAPKYIVEWLEVIGPEGNEQFGFFRVGCASTEEVQTEIRSRSGDKSLTSLCVLARNGAGTYDYVRADEDREAP